MSILVWDDKQVKDLTPNEFKELRRLCFRSKGFMFYDLERAVVDKPTAHVITLRNQEGRLIGWSYIGPSWEDRSKGRSTVVQLYVRASERRKGYGTQLLERSRKYSKRPLVMPYDKASGEFYSKFKYLRVDPVLRKDYMR